MSKDTITVNMNVHDIPILVETLEKSNKEIERLNNIIKEVREYAQELRLYDNESIEFEISNDLFRILDKENK